MEQVLSLLGDSGYIHVYLMIFVLLLSSGLGIFSEDITFIATGYIAYKGVINPYIAIIIGILGVMIGDSFLYFIGYKFGKKIFSLPLLKNLFTEERQNKASSLLKKKGKLIIFIIRFLPGFRAPSYFSCGSLGIRYGHFLLIDFIAAVFSVSALIFLSMSSGMYIDKLVKVVKTIEHSVIVLVCIAVFLFVLYLINSERKKKRAHHAN